MQMRSVAYYKELLGKKELIKKLYVSSFNEYLNAISAIDESYNSRVLFRGLSNKKYEATSSAYRKLEKLLENKQVWHHFKDYHSKLISNALSLKVEEIDRHKDSDIDILAHLQHIEEKTCLIDYTKNPLVALWFACQSSKNKDIKEPTDGAVLAIKSSLNISRIDEKFNVERLFDRDLSAICIFDPPYINRRVISQQSTFLFSSMGKIDEYRHIKIVIAQGCKEAILTQLKQLCIHKKTLFPDIEGSKEWLEYNGSNEEKYYDLVEKADKSYREFDYRAAIDYFEQALEADIKGEEIEKATIYNNIGRAYYKSEKYDEALDYYETAQKIREKVLGEYHPDTATTYNYIGAAHRKKYEYEKALKYYKKALRIRWDVDKKLSEEFNKELIKKSSDTATTYDHIGLVRDGQIEYNNALRHYKKALRIRKEVLGEQHPDTANTYNNLGKTLCHQCKYEEALESHKRALKIQERVLGNHPDTAKTYNDIGMIYTKQRKHDKALNCYEKALSIRGGKALGDQYQDTAKTYNNMGETYYYKHEYDKAWDWYEKALNLREKNLEKDHPDNAKTYNDMGMVHFIKETYDKALDCYTKASEICKKKLDKKHPYAIEVNRNMRIVKKKLNKKQKAQS
jgi:tetratricopeptide (TPR) repeat protein